MSVYCNCGKGLGVCVRNQKFVLVSWIIFFMTEQHLDTSLVKEQGDRRNSSQDSVVAFPIILLLSRPFVMQVVQRSWVHDPTLHAIAQLHIG